MVPGGDGGYINADYINARHLFQIPFCYIATQAPLSNTVADFWRMVWEHNVCFVVMLTAEVEMGALKCVRYWPIRGGTTQVRNMFLQTMEESVTPEGVYRTIRITVGAESRFVKHFLYSAWPPGGVPHSAVGLLDIILEMGKYSESVLAPIVVHCGGGVGRTGVFIALHIALCHFQMERQFHLDAILLALRRCRMGLLQRYDHYEYTYRAVLEGMARMLTMFRTASKEHAMQQQQQRTAAVRAQPTIQPRRLPTEPSPPAEAPVSHPTSPRAAPPPPAAVPIEPQGNMMRKKGAETDALRDRLAALQAENQARRATPNRSMGPSGVIAPQQKATTRNEAIPVVPTAPAFDDDKAANIPVPPVENTAKIGWSSQQYRSGSQGRETTGGSMPGSSVGVSRLPKTFGVLNSKPEYALL